MTSKAEDSGGASLMLRRLLKALQALLLGFFASLLEREGACLVGFRPWLL